MKRSYIIIVFVLLLCSTPSVVSGQAFSKGPLTGYQDLYEVGSSLPIVPLPSESGSQSGVMPIAGRGGFIPNPPDVDDTDIENGRQQTPNGYSLPLGDALLPLLIYALCFALLCRYKHARKTRREVFLK